MGYQPSASWATTGERGWLTEWRQTTLKQSGAWRSSKSFNKRHVGSLHASGNEGVPLVVIGQAISPARNADYRRSDLLSNGRSGAGPRIIVSMGSIRDPWKAIKSGYVIRHACTQCAKQIAQCVRWTAARSLRQDARCEDNRMAPFRLVEFGVSRATGDPLRLWKAWTQNLSGAESIGTLMPEENPDALWLRQCLS